MRKVLYIMFSMWVSVLCGGVYTVLLAAPIPLPLPPIGGVGKIKKSITTTLSRADVTLVIAQVFFVVLLILVLMLLLALAILFVQWLRRRYLAGLIVRLHFECVLGKTTSCDTNKDTEKTISLIRSYLASSFFGRTRNAYYRERVESVLALVESGQVSFDTKEELLFNLIELVRCI